VVAGSEDEMAAGAAGHGRMRASHADREQVIEALKDAFAQGRLTGDELDSRVGQAFASLTHGDLAALTADLPAAPTAVRPLRKPARAETQAPLAVPMIIAMTMLTAGSWMGALFYQDKIWAIVVFVVTFTWLGIVILAGVVMLESQREKRSGGQLPSRPGRLGFEGQDTPAGHDPALPGVRSDQARTDMRTHCPRPVGRTYTTSPTVYPIQPRRPGLTWLRVPFLVRSALEAQAAG